MSNSNPRVSVVMSVYNGEKYLRDAVDSILDQTFTDFEFIIVDDCSTDQTAKILDGFTDARIIRIKNEKNLLLSGSLNKGIAIARGEYIARMDADDISLPERLKKQVEYLDSNPKIGVLGTWIQYMDEDGSLAQQVQYTLNPDYFRWQLCFRNPLAHSSTMIRRWLFEKEIYNQEYELAQDYDLWGRFSELTDISSLGEILVLLRRHQANVSRKHTALQQQFAFRTSCKFISKLLQEVISNDIIVKMLSNAPLSMSDSRAVLEVIGKLWSVFIKENLSALARAQIDRDYANRLFDYSAPYYRSFYFQKKIIKACLIHPALVNRLFFAFIRRITKLMFFRQASL